MGVFLTPMYGLLLFYLHGQLKIQWAKIIGRRLCGKKDNKSININLSKTAHNQKMKTKRRREI